MANVIDVWAQHPTERFLAQPFFDSRGRWTGQQFKAVPLEVTAEAMRTAGISRALLCAWYGLTGPLISNEEVLEATTRYPDLFAGSASADLRNPVEAVRTIREDVSEHGFKGVRVVQWLWELPCTHPLYDPIFAACVEMNVPVCLQSVLPVRCAALS